MHIIKLSTGVSEVISIEKDLYEKRTLKESPYYQLNRSGEVVQYAVCPQCDNPVQLVGLYKKLKHTERPFGKHAGKSIPGIAVHHQEDYEFCPFARKRAVSKRDRKKDSSGVPNEILSLLKFQFDRVLYLLSKDTTIRFSENLIRSMLKNYLATAGFLYAGATLNNLPWIFGYMADSQQLFGQQIQKGGALHQAIINRCLEADFIEGGDPKFVRLSAQKGKYVSLNFCFIEHQREVIQNELVETVDFIVHEGHTYNDSARIIFQETLTIDSTYFLNLINSAGTGMRSEKQLEIAQELLADFQTS